MAWMIVGVTSDWHFDATTAGQSRLREITRWAETFGREMSDSGVELLLHLGDMFDPGRDDLRWSAHLIMLARELSRHALVASVWLAGNHDVVDRDETVTSLSPLREAAALSDTGVIVAETPGVYGITGSELEVVVLALPYPSKSDVPAWESLVDQAIGKIPEGATTIVASHLCVKGAAMGSESRDMARGTDVYLMPEWLERVGPALVVNGHYHRRQVVPCGGHDVHVPGSPVRLRFDEAEEEHKGGFIVSIDRELVPDEDGGDDADED